MSDHAEIVMQLTADLVRHNHGVDAARRLFRRIARGEIAASQEYMTMTVNVIQAYMRHADIDAGVLRELGFAVDPEVPSHARVASVELAPARLGAEFRFHLWQEHAC